MINMETDKIIDDANASLQVSEEAQFALGVEEKGGGKGKLPPSCAPCRTCPAPTLRNVGYGFEIPRSRDE